MKHMLGNSAAQGSIHMTGMSCPQGKSREIPDRYPLFKVIFMKGVMGKSYRPGYTHETRVE